MVHPDNHRSDCLERARMHERLATSTNDTAARQMHQAMAAEFRRRASQESAGGMVPEDRSGPILEVAPGRALTG